MREQGLGPLGRRLLAAFAVVALSSVVVLTVIALVGTGRGIAASQASDRAAAAATAASAAARAYAAQGGWTGADLAAVDDVASSAGARLLVRDAEGDVVQAPGAGMGSGMGAGMMNGGAGRALVSQDVVVDGVVVGTVTLGFGASSSSAEQVAWTWILLAAAVALVVAFIAAWAVTRRLTRPLVRLVDVADQVASGSLSARPSPQDLQEPGELGELARAFATAAERVESADRSRRAMSADLAHELRTPLTVLQAGLEELRDGLETPDPEHLESLHRQSLRLGRIVDDLAELSAAESATLSLRNDPVDLSALARDAVREAAPSLAAAGVDATVSAGAPLIVLGDADRLHQVVGNLLANAARYCRPGDHVVVTARARGDQCLLEVADDGPGIDAADLPHVFDRLWRGRADVDVAGSGIGLAVVRELVVAHGGSVTAESDGEHGTTVTVQLPLAPR